MFGAESIRVAGRLGRIGFETPDVRSDGVSRRYCRPPIPDEDACMDSSGAQPAADSLAIRLAGRVAFVTGSSRNIGRAIALAFARAGADVVVHARSSCEE